MRLMPGIRKLKGCSENYLTEIHNYIHLCKTANVYLHVRVF